MRNKILDDFKKIIGEDSIFSIRGAISPLFLVITWQGEETKNPLHILSLNKGRDSYLALNENRYIAIATDRFKEYFENEVSLKELQDEYFDFEKNTQNLYDKLTNTNLKTLSNEDIYAFLNKIDFVFKQLADSTLYVENVDYEKILSIIGIQNKALLDEIWGKAVEPVFVSFEQRRMKLMLDLIKEENSVRKAKFIFTDYFWTKRETEIEDALNEVNKSYSENMEKYIRNKNTSEIKLKEHTEWIKTLGETSSRIAEFMQWVMQMRDIRKDPIAQIQAMLAEVSVEILDRADIEKEHAPNVLLYEYLKGLEYIISIKENIIQRKNGCIYIVSPGFTFEIELCNFEQTLNELDSYIKNKINHSVKEITGQIACKGIVRGKVRIILDPHKENAFEDGDILVTSMTRPEFVPLMKRAGAVITNEGGITCHAAIVSRELNIPCIIGTKNATHILKDEDFVEVDAEKGIVKKIA